MKRNLKVVQSVCFNAKQLAKLKQIAEKEDDSLSKVVRDSIDLYISWYSKSKQPQEEIR